MPYLSIYSYVFNEYVFFLMSFQWYLMNGYCSKMDFKFCAM